MIGSGCCTVLLFLIFCFHSAESFSQEKKRVLINKITKDYIRIPGTKISMFLPKNFVLANDFKGLRNNSTGSTIMISDIPGSIKNNIQGFSKEMLQNTGVFVLGKQDFKINNLYAVLIKAKQFAYQNSYLKWLLILGNEKETYLITGSFLEKLNEDQSSVVLGSMLSVVYESEKKISPGDGMSFELNVKNTKFKLAKLVTNSLIYTVDGIVPTNSVDKSTITASAALLPFKVKDKKKYCIESLKQIPTVKEINENNISEFSADGISGYEMHTFGMKNQKKNELLYQLILFDDAMSYSIVGISIDNFDDNLKLFKQIAKTFKRKK